MATIEIPKKLERLLKGSELEAPIRALADQVGKIVADNKVTFFPDYTDHGIDHINGVLKSEVELVPQEVWQRSTSGSNPRLLCDADAAVIIGATLLHDFAMHLHPAGFSKLVAKDSRFKPLRWFEEDHEGYAADRPWPELWADFQREARRFSDRALGNIIGLDSVRNGWKFDSLPEDLGEWQRNHLLVVGEFLRRHHARLAHEIAIYGFPGLESGGGEHQFPAIGSEPGDKLKELADLIGVVARSHGMSMRVCQAYLQANNPYRRLPRPLGSAVLYPMALLRVADYLQIDKPRAPAVLLQLRDPQSPISLQEWKKHSAVLTIGSSNDPRGIMVTVSNTVRLETFLQLKDLFASVQAEIDISTAVLDEAYGTHTKLGLHRLGLDIRRIHSNLFDPDFRKQLPYVPERVGFSTDPNLLVLLVEPLYGKHPGVGVRELIQNAVDAVCELDVWCSNRGIKSSEIDLPDQDPDVLIEYIKRKDGTWILKAQDKGIGMSAATLQDYFLRAGASFRQSSEWAAEFRDEAGEPKVLRSGRFGIGAFATFLLGRTFRVSTRHASEGVDCGYFLAASVDSLNIEVIRTPGLRIGTTIEVDLAASTVEYLRLEEHRMNSSSQPLENNRADWYCWDWPEVVQQIRRPDGVAVLRQTWREALRGGCPGPEWSLIYPEGFAGVYWTFLQWPDLVCNGIIVANPGYAIYDLQSAAMSEIWWPEPVGLRRPNIACLDISEKLPLSIQRYGLSRGLLPFTDDLVTDVILSFIAHGLVTAPDSRRDFLAGWERHPLSSEASNFSFFDNWHGWCSALHGMVPFDSWLLPQLGAKRYMIWGAINSGQFYSSDYLFNAGLWGERTGRDCVLLNRDCVLPPEDAEGNWGTNDVAVEAEGILGRLAIDGIPAGGIAVSAAQVLVSAKAVVSWPLRDEGHSGAEENHRTWSRIKIRGKRRSLYALNVGNLAPQHKLKPVLDQIGRANGGDRPGRQRKGLPEVLFLAELQVKFSPSSRNPLSNLALIWNECLGPNAIPFDPTARKLLIERGRRHAGLRRHIEAWEQMKAQKAEAASTQPEPTPNEGQQRDR